MREIRTVFLTGGTGFIGRRVAGLLSARGTAVRCLVRATSDTSGLAALGVERVVGDVTGGPDALARAMAGVDAAIHLAAIYDVGVVDGREMERVNVAGTRAFLDAVRLSGLERAVHVSTTAALGPVAQGMGAPDAEWAGPYPSAYHRTKAEAFRMARVAQSEGLPLVIVSPGFVYGPGDEGPGGRLIRDLVRGRVPGLLSDPGWSSFLHVDDAAAGIVAALDRGRPGASYVLGGEVASINDFASRVSRLAGRRPPPLRMPRGLALMLGSVLDAVSRLTGLRFGVTREGVAVTAGLRFVHDDSVARADLGWRPRSLDEGLAETVEAFLR